jgi:hypothetical protein
LRDAARDARSFGARSRATADWPLRNRRVTRGRSTVQ